MFRKFYFTVRNGVAKYRTTLAFDRGWLRGGRENRPVDKAVKSLDQSV